MSMAGNENSENVVHESFDKRQKINSHVANLYQRVPEIKKVFHVHHQIGHGTFSTVLLASIKGQESLPTEERRLFAIKHLIPTVHPTRTEREVRCLRMIGGVDNVVGVDLCFRCEDSVAVVMPYIAHDKFADYFDRMTPRDVREYMRNLLIALRRVHSFNIIHRDVKPNNFLHNRQTNEYLLVDFGLAQELSVDKRKSLVDEPNSKRRKLRVTPKKSQSLPNNVGNNNENSPSKPNSSVAMVNGNKSPLKPANVIASGKSGGELSAGHRHSTKPLNSVVELVPSSASGQIGPDMVRSCSCYGRNTICNICLIKKDIVAPRAGTPGYRPPEVLLKCTDQTTAVDIWAAGVILLSILSRCYPFFHAPDDLTALAEMTTIFGDEKIKKMALNLDRHVLMSSKREPLNLQKLCLMLRRRSSAANRSASSKGTTKCDNCSQWTHQCLCMRPHPHSGMDLATDEFSSRTYELLDRLLEINHRYRISASDALDLPYFTEEDL